MSYVDNLKKMGVSGIIYKKGEPLVPRSEVDKLCLRLTLSGEFIKEKGNVMSDEVSKATEIVDNAVDGFSKSLSRFLALEKSFQSEAKRTSGAARDAAERLSDGIIRIEKAADLQKLERYVDLLERMAKSCSILADLNQSGRLDGIAKALKQ